MPEGGGGVRGQNALIKIAMKQYLGRFMILEDGRGEGGGCRTLYLR